MLDSYSSLLLALIVIISLPLYFYSWIKKKIKTYNDMKDVVIELNKEVKKHDILINDQQRKINIMSDFIRQRFNDIDIVIDHISKEKI